MRYAMGLLICSLTATGGVAFADEAPAYDDPAIAACQYIVFRGGDPARENYRRLEAAIEGRKVRLVFERSILNTRPKTSEIECQFVLNIEGRFIMTADSPVDEAAPAVVECRRIMAEGPEKIESGSLDMGETSFIRSKMGLCERTLGHRPELAAKLKPLLNELTATGIYPIYPADTALRVGQ